MKLIQQLLNLEGRFPFNLAGAFLGASGLALTLWTLRPADPPRGHLELRVLSWARLIDVREDVATLQISFAGSDIRKEGRMLSVALLRLSNTGSVAIRESEFSDIDPPGFSWQGAEVVSFEKLGGSDDHLKRFFDVHRADSATDRQFLINKAMLDRGASAEFKFVLLHEETLRPRLTATGKISDHPPLTAIQGTEAPPSDTLWVQVVGTAWTVRVLRLMFFGGCTVAILVGLLVVDQIWRQLRRRSRRQAFWRRSGFAEERDPELAFLGRLYLREGLVPIHGLSDQRERLAAEARRWSTSRTGEALHRMSKAAEAFASSLQEEVLKRLGIAELAAPNIVYAEGGSVVVSASFFSRIDAVVAAASQAGAT